MAEQNPRLRGVEICSLSSLMLAQERCKRLAGQVQLIKQPNCGAPGQSEQELRGDK